MEFTVQEVKELCPKVKDLENFTESLNLTLKKYKINTPLRVAAFLSRMGHESWDFTKFEEVWTNTPQQRKYDPSSGSSVARVLGNTQVGDGFKFRGRSIIQLTGRSNYAQYSKAVGFDFVTNPDRLKEYPWNIDCAGWFWSTRNLNVLADRGDIVGVVKRINGGTNGLQDTQNRYVKYLQWFKKNGYT